MISQNLRSKIAPTWCPGCNDYMLFAGIQQAINALDIKKENLVLVFDIGCVGNMADFFATYGIHSLHGRCIPTALGVKMANPKLTVIAIGGDGGIYGEGLGHLIAAARLNVDITVLVANNNLYSLTTGQTSPTTPRGSKTKSTPLGSPYLEFDPIKIIKAVNPDVHAFSADGRHPVSVADAIKEAIVKPGFSLVDFYQVCVTFGKQLAT